MKRFFLIALTGIVAISLATFTGCGSKQPAAKPAAEHFEGDGHDHSKDTGDHSGHDHEKEPSK